MCIGLCLGRKGGRSGGQQIPTVLHLFKGLGTSLESQAQGSLEVSLSQLGWPLPTGLSGGRCSISLSEHSQAKLNLKVTWMEGVGCFWNLLCHSHTLPHPDPLSLNPLSCFPRSGAHPLVNPHLANPQQGRAQGMVQSSQSCRRITGGKQGSFKSKLPEDSFPP